MNQRIYLAVAMMAAVFAPGIAGAAEMDHSKMTGMDHSKMDHSKMMHMSPPKTKKGKLAMVKEQPASGKSREAGFDGRYNMEPTTALNSLATQCAQASRGMILLDNKTWARCGGKTKGVAEGPMPAKAGGSHSSHSGH